MALYLTWLLTAAFLWRASQECQKIIGKEAYVGYAGAIFIFVLTLWNMVNQYGG